MIGKNLRSLVQYVRNRQITIITCVEQIHELTEAFRKPKLQKHFHPSQTATFLSFLREVSLTVPITAPVPLCRDPKDDYLLALSVKSDACYLVTGDKDLLDIQKINNTLIIKYADFETVMNEK
jgi:putative PIN family toxin of toxin-antitoxin system